MRDIIARRVYRKLKKISDTNSSAGRHWYSAAHDEAVSLSEKYPISTERAAAIIAVLSPGTSWEQNIKDAWELCEFKHDAIVTTYPLNKHKALAIFEGRPLFDYVRGNKVRSFFDNIARPEISTAVTLDRHMLRFMLQSKDDRELQKVFSSSRNYSAMSERIRRHAYKRGLKPHELQAMLWLQVREDSNAR